MTAPEFAVQVAGEEVPVTRETEVHVARELLREEARVLLLDELTATRDQTVVARADGVGRASDVEEASVRSHTTLVPACILARALEASISRGRLAPATRRVEAEVLVRAVQSDEVSMLCPCILRCGGKHIPQIELMQADVRRSSSRGRQLALTLSRGSFRREGTGRRVGDASRFASGQERALECSESFRAAHGSEVLATTTEHGRRNDEWCRG
jgi:hypothetical protein